MGLHLLCSFFVPFHQCTVSSSHGDRMILYCCLFLFRCECVFPFWNFCFSLSIFSNSNYTHTCSFLSFHFWDQFCNDYLFRFVWKWKISYCSTVHNTFLSVLFFQAEQCYLKHSHLIWTQPLIIPLLRVQLYGMEWLLSCVNASSMVIVSMQLFDEN